MSDIQIARGLRGRAAAQFWKGSKRERSSVRAFFWVSVAAIAAGLTGCETTNFAKSSTPATIRQEFVRHNANLFSPDWEGSYVYGVGRYELGYGDLGDRKALTLSFDPGAADIKAFYFGHKGAVGTLFLLTDIVTLHADLKANAHYALHCDANDDVVQFKLIDLGTNEIVASLPDVPIYHRPHPAPSNVAVVPIFIPHR
jgi:hypothetical protein